MSSSVQDAERVLALERNIEALNTCIPHNPVLARITVMRSIRILLEGRDGMLLAKVLTTVYQIPR